MEKTNNCSVRTILDVPVIFVGVQPLWYLPNTTHGTNSQILGRAVKNEHLALGIFTTVFGGAWLATRGGAKAAPKPTTVQQAKESVLVKADST